MPGTGNSSIADLVSTHDRLLANLAKLREALARTREVLQRLEGALDAVRGAAQGLGGIDPVLDAVTRGCGRLDGEPVIGPGFAQAGGHAKALLDATRRVSAPLSRCEDTVRPIRRALSGAIRRVADIESLAERFERLVTSERDKARDTDSALGGAPQGRYLQTSLARFAGAAQTLSPGLAAQGIALARATGTLQDVADACATMLELLVGVEQCAAGIRRCAETLQDNPERVQDVLLALDRDCLGISVRDALRGDRYAYPRNRIALNMAHKIVDPFVDRAMPRFSFDAQALLDVEAPCARAASILEQTWRTTRRVTAVLEGALSGTSTSGLYAAVPA